MKNLKITKGEWFPNVISTITIGVNAEIETTEAGVYSQNVCEFILPETDKEYEKERVEREANAQLIADAGTTANKCGKLPSELLAERDELLAIMKGLVSDVDGLLQEEDIEWQQAGYLETARGLINKTLSK